MEFYHYLLVFECEGRGCIVSELLLGGNKVNKCVMARVISRVLTDYSYVARFGHSIPNTAHARGIGETDL